MGLLRGTSDVSTGFAAAELDALADAVAASDCAREVLASPDDPEAVLDALTADPNAGPGARAYLDAVRYRSIGYDVGEPCAGELPAMLVGAVRAALAHRKAGPDGDDGDAALTAIRARVPAEHLAEFDDRLHEARLPNRLRDERATYSDGWAVGLARRALLEAVAGSPRAARSQTRDMPSTWTSSSSRRCCAASQARAQRGWPNGLSDGRRGQSTMPGRSSGRRRHRPRRWTRSRSRPGAPRSP